MKFVYFFVWCWEWLGDLLLICWCCIPGCKSCFVIKMVISSFSFEHVNCIVSETWLWYKDVSFRGSYRAPRWILYFEGRIARHEGYYLSRVVSCVATDAWTDMSPMGPGLRDNGCVSLGKTCITIFDIASHGIEHFIIDELEHVFYWSCDCFSVKSVIVEYWVVIENV